MSSEPTPQTESKTTGDSFIARQRKSRRRRQRAKEMALWGHALQRLRERYTPDATMPELKELARAATKIYRDHVRGVRPVIYAGGVLRVDGIEAVVVRCPYRAGWVKVVLSPMDGVIRTVLL